MSWPGSAFSKSKRSGGLRPVANSGGVFPPKVNEMFRARVVFCTYTRGVMWRRVGSSKHAETTLMNCFLNSRTAVSARFGQGVYGPSGMNLIRSKL